MQKGSSLIIIILSVLLIVTISLVFFLLGRQSANISNPVSTNIKDNSTGLTSATAKLESSAPVTKNTNNTETRDWKTYSYSGLTFKYPPIAQPSEDSTGLLFSESTTAPGLLIGLNSSVNTNHTTSLQVALEEIDEIRRNVSGCPFCKAQANDMTSTMKEYSSGSISGIKLRSYSEGYDSGGYGEFIFVTPQKVYKLNVHDGNGSVSPTEEKIMDNIISTIQFE